jgi:hypothetical protein
MSETGDQAGGASRSHGETGAHPPPASTHCQYCGLGVNTSAKVTWLLTDSENSSPTGSYPPALHFAKATSPNSST